MISHLILTIGNVYSIMIIIYCFMTWIPNSTTGIMGDIRTFFAAVCEPFLKPFRQIIPPIGGTLDISPIIALLVLQLLVEFLARLL